jgi:photosystem II stability/assembly factor-like uncharacterized protein
MIVRRLLSVLLLLAAAPASAGVDRWTPYGPSGGSISDIVLDPRSPSTLWIASGPVYKSEDGGASFHLSASGLEGRAIQFLAIDPGQPDVLYAVPFSYNAGVYRSQDGGAHWALIAGGDDFSFISSLAVAPGPPGAPGIVFVGTTVRLYRSVDGGATFQPVISFGTAEDFVAVAPDPRNPGIVYAATLSQRFKSTDFGATWSDLVEDPAFPPWVHDLVVAPGDPQTLYETGDGADVGATWRSRDGGTTWQGPFPFRGDVLAVDPADSNTVYGGSVLGLFVSHDGGETFTAVTEGVPPLSIELIQYYGVSALTIDPARPGYALAGTGQGFLATEDRGATWTVQPQRGLINNPVTNFRIDPFDPAHWILNSLGSYSESHDRGRTFAPFADSLLRTEGIFDVEPDPFVRDRLWALTGRGLILSRDGGATWLHRGPTPTGSSNLLLPAPGIALLRAGDGIYRSTNAGHTWHHVRPLPYVDPYRFQHLEQDPRSLRTIYGLGGRSDDAGRTWRPWHQADAIGFDPFRPRHVHLVEGDTLLITRDGGSTFQTVGHLGLTGPDARVLALLFDRDRRDVLYAVTYAHGVLRSRDGGATWESLNTGLPAVYPSRDTSLVQDPANGQRFYFMPDAGLYRADFTNGPP